MTDKTNDSSIHIQTTETISEHRSINVDDILDTELVVYSYKTQDDESGTLILNTRVNPRLESYFENGVLFTMESMTKRKLRIRDLLLDGVTTVGSTDVMETVKLRIPDKRISSEKPSITGKYVHGSRKTVISEPLATDFDCYPESDSEPEHEYTNFDDDNETYQPSQLSDNQTVDVNWLAN